MDIINDILKLLFALVIFIAVFGGWVQSIYKFTQCDFEAPYKAEICYGVGLAPPIGMIIGWTNIED